MIRALTRWAIRAALTAYDRLLVAVGAIDAEVCRWPNETHQEVDQ